jgi:hypothetical protein
MLCRKTEGNISLADLGIHWLITLKRILETSCKEFKEIVDWVLMEELRDSSGLLRAL